MTEPARPAPKATHYVSLHNHVIHPAMSSPAGYEDEHPTEWRPATATERERFLAGEHSVSIEPLPLALPAEGEPRAVPSTIQLQDGPETPLPQVQMPAQTVGPAPIAAAEPVPLNAEPVPPPAPVPLGPAPAIEPAIQPIPPALQNE